MTSPLTVKHPIELLPFLFAGLPNVKKTKVRQWLKFGAIQVNGRAITRANHALKVGDRISFLAKGDVQAESRLPAGLNIVFEDPSLIVVDKPQNLLSMASASEREKTAYAFLTEYVRRGNRKSSRRVWIVHRLDRETSGLMVFAKTEAVKRVLQSDWDNVEKRYLAVVEGNPPATCGVLTSHLDETGPFKVYSAPESDRTRLAVTHYRVVKQTTTSALVELTLKTGRRNQIRVQLADINCPIIGDQKYGARTNPARRLGLHATFLQFKHPVTTQVLKFESAPPETLARLI